MVYQKAFTVLPEEWLLMTILGPSLKKDGLPGRNSKEVTHLANDFLGKTDYT